MIEAVVKVSNSESKLTRREPIYDNDIKLNTDDPKLIEIVGKALREFEKSGQPEDVVLTLKMVF